MNRLLWTFVALLLATTLDLPMPVGAAGAWWPQFRGPNCSGVSDTATPPATFGPGTNEHWKIAVPAGVSSPVIWSNHLFLTDLDAGQLEVRSYDRTDGRLRWKQTVPATRLEDYHSTEGSPAASSCATDGQRVVSYFGSFGLICHDFSGKELWRHPLPIAETTGGFGTGSSPTLAGSLVVVNRDMQRGGLLLAVNLKDGKLAWETQRPDVQQSYGSAIVWKNGGVDEIVMSGSLKLKGYDPKTGREKWSLGGMPSFTCTTPVIGDDVLFFAGWTPGKGDSPMPTFAQTAESFDKNKDNAITPDEVKGTPLESFFRAQDVDGNGRITAEDYATMTKMMTKGDNCLVAIRPGGRGELGTNQIVWRQTRGLPYVPSPLYYQGKVYVVKDGGMLSCYDGKTGKAIYQQERLNALGNYYASPVAADGRIIMASLDGKMTVVAAGGETPRILHQMDFKERIAATPALAENYLYVRTPTSLYAFGGK